MSDLIMIVDGEGEIPQGKRPEPILDSLKLFHIPHTVIDTRYELGLKDRVNKENQSAELAIITSGETYVSGPRLFTAYAVQYYNLVDDPEYAQKLKEAVQAHHGN